MWRSELRLRGRRRSDDAARAPSRQANLDRGRLHCARWGEGLTAASRPRDAHAGPRDRHAVFSDDLGLFLGPNHTSPF